MKRLLSIYLSLKADERGAATAEYALLLALVVIILIGSLGTLGSVLNDKISDIITSLNAAH